MLSCKILDKKNSANNITMWHLTQKSRDFAWFCDLDTKFEHGVTQAFLAWSKFQGEFNRLARFVVKKSIQYNSLTWAILVLIGIYETLSF